MKKLVKLSLGLLLILGLISCGTEKMKLISPVSLKTFEHNYTVISFSNCEIASLSTPQGEFLGTYEYKEDLNEVICSFSSNKEIITNVVFSYDKENKQIIVKDSNYLTKDEVFPLKKEIVIDKKIAGNNYTFLESVSISLNKCGTAVVKFSSNGIEEVVYGIYDCDKESGKVSLYNYEWIFDTKNNTINSKECVVVPLDGNENPIVGKTYADKYTKINFLDCGIAVGTAVFKGQQETSQMTIYNYSLNEDLLQLGTSKDMLLVKYDPINDFICVENTILTVDNNKIPSNYENPIYKDFDLKNDVNFSRTLSLKGSRMHGDDVVQLQQSLLDLGFEGVGEADGWYGPATDKALCEYLAFFGYPYVGKMTKGLYDIMYSNEVQYKEYNKAIKMINNTSNKINYSNYISLGDPTKIVGELSPSLRISFLDGIVTELQGSKKNNKWGEIFTVYKVYFLPDNAKIINCREAYFDYHSKEDVTTNMIGTYYIKDGVCYRVKNGEFVKAELSSKIQNFLFEEFGLEKFY